MTAHSNPNRAPIMLPDIGCGDQPLRVSAWLIEPGHAVVAGDRVVEVLIPGMTFDVSAVQTGELIEISRDVDSLVSPGDILGWIACENP
jgi:pyruvate/2-oxoglutarate dehydrogenase complex dihydrolipoamide acyltransferase (E2) component